MNKLTLLIPVFNEAESILKFIPEVIAFAKENDFSVIVIDDGSTDDSLVILEGYSKESCLKILKNKVNRGYGGALKRGIEEAETEFVIMVDADGQHRLEDVKKLFDKIRETDADMVIGRRKSQRGKMFRSLGKLVIRFIAKMLMDVPVVDINSGLKVFKAELGKKYLHLYPDSMSFSDIICLVFISNRHKVLEEPIVVEKRKGGKSTIGVMTAFQTVMEILNIITMFNPMKIFLSISILLFVLGFGWGLRFLLNHLGISIGASMLLIMSVLVFLLGLIAEQLSAIRKNK